MGAQKDISAKDSDTAVAVLAKPAHFDRIRIRLLIKPDLDPGSDLRLYIQLTYEIVQNAVFLDSVGGSGPVWTGSGSDL
jgi:hypothetical protein